MSFPDDKISFKLNNVDYNFILAKGTSSPIKLVINGITYSVFSNEEQIKVIQKIFNSISLDSIESIKDLSNRIDSWKTNSSKLDWVAQILANKNKISTWPDREINEILPKKRSLVAEQMWARFKQTGEKPIAFQRFLQITDEELQIGLKDRESFKHLFDNLTREHLSMIINGERLERIPAKDHIDLKDIHYLEKHIKEIGFSGVIALSDKKNIYNLKSEKIPSAAPFSIHSIGKLFTSLTTLLAVSEVIEKPVELDSTILNLLPDKVRNHMKTHKPSLKDFMNHTSGLGDYLGNYQDSINVFLLLKEFNKVSNGFKTVEEFFEWIVEHVLQSDHEVFQNSKVVELFLLTIQRKNLIPKKLFNEQIGSIERLPIQIRNHLSNIQPLTLQQIMLLGIGDQLENYQRLNIEKVANVTKPEDLLVFSENKVYKFGDYHYSNLGMIILGLSVQTEYNNKHKTTKSYHEILNEKVIQPSGIKNFTSLKPKAGYFNKKDVAASYIFGGPAGGYWTTALDLIKLGKWINYKYQSTEFRDLVKKYGQDFYENGEIKHAGEIDSASAYFSTFLDSGITISVLSDQGQSTASKVFDDIMDFIFL